MDRDFSAETVEILDSHRVMMIATNRRDGWPHATVVSYSNVGLVIYCIVRLNTQKHLNIARDPRVSVAIGDDCADPLQYKGLSLAGRATISEDRTEIEMVRGIVLARHPKYKQMMAPAPERIGVLRIMPEIVSIIDYSKGFGHSDKVRIVPDGPVEFIEAYRHHWAGLQAV